ncbi:MAG: hypothetical protein EPN60_06575 [Nevskiaceae bacterium]|nr:MAG: hypothetical protein EPO48_05510 [Nevskiaceae bacterium]TAM29012.1 MAG: hypothetical protein EPN60_06575 [Nevskiaceae bacterium]
MPPPEVPPPWESTGPAGATATTIPPADTTGDHAAQARLPAPAEAPASYAEEPGPRRPAIYLASDPLGSLPGLPPVADEGLPPPPAMSGAPPSSASTPVPGSAWRQATIPEGSNRTPVGRMPPPAAVPGFQIGAGDTVDITVLGRPELSASGNVSGDGLITAALVGAVPVLGLTPQQAARRIAQAYKDGQYLVDPQVTVTLRDYQSQQLSVLGEVKSPGRFPMRTRLSILDALALAGGINDSGAQLAYILRPEDSVVTRYEIDLDALLQAGAGQQYFELLAGDTVVVPKAELFYIYGEVKSPNAYKLKPGLTVIQALSLAGGLSDKGSDRRIDIRRRDDEGELRTQAATLSDALLPNDVIYVRERLF